MDELSFEDLPLKHPRKGQTEHPLFDFELWEARCPWNPEDKSGCRLVTPTDIVRHERTRRHVLAQIPDLETTIYFSDVFVWGVGEPPKPYLTKLGGVPHRERSLPWPKDKKGQPMYFVGQWCFLDSVGIYDRIEFPAPVLLLFHSYPDEVPDGEPGYHHFEWSNVELRQPCTRADIPYDDPKMPNLHGVIHRTVELPELAFPDESQKEEGERFAKDVFEKRGYRESYLLCTSQATRIGPETWYIQGTFPEEDEVLLCTFSSVSCDYYLEENPYRPHSPWYLTNVEDIAKMTDEQRAALKHGFHMGDAGCLYVFFNPETKQLRLAADCY